MRQPFAMTTRNSALRRHNRRLLLLALLANQPVSRIRLARLTGLSTTTITNLTADLMAEGVIDEMGVDAIAQSKGAGRPPLALRLAPDSRYAIGVHVGVRTVRVALCNLMATVQEEATFPIVAGSPPGSVIDQVVAIVTDLRARHPRVNEARRLAGVGVGASGLVDGLTGVNYLAPNLGWHDVPLRDLFQTALNLPVTMDNNVRYMALGESLYGAGRGVRALAFVFARVGLAAGLVVDGKIYRGAGYGAGEIGHWMMMPERPDRAPRVALEDLLSERTLVRLAREMAPDALPRASTDTVEEMHALLAAARAGHGPVRAMLAERARVLGVAMANLADVLNPERLILGGYLAEGFDLFAPTLTAAMRRYAFAGLADKVEILPATFGSRAGVVGAAAGALNRFFFGAAASETDW